MANFQVSVEDTVDYTVLEKLSKQQTILVGYIGNDTHPGSGKPMAEIAKTLTYGQGGTSTWTTTKRRNGVNVVSTHTVKGIPARPFLDKGILYHRSDIEKRVEAFYQGLMKKDPNTPSLLEQIGLACIVGIQLFITASGFWKGNAPNSDTTIAAKGSDTPLVDTGKLVNSIVSVVDGKIVKN